MIEVPAPILAPNAPRRSGIPFGTTPEAWSPSPAVRAALGEPPDPVPMALEPEATGLPAPRARAIARSIAGAALALRAKAEAAARGALEEERRAAGSGVATGARPVGLGRRERIAWACIVAVAAAAGALVGLVAGLQ